MRGITWQHSTDLKGMGWGHARFPHKSTSQRRTFGCCASAASGRPGIHRRGLCCAAHPAGHPDRRVLRAERRSRGALSKQSARPSEISLHLARLLTRDDMLDFCRCRPSPAKCRMPPRQREAPPAASQSLAGGFSCKSPRHPNHMSGPRHRRTPWHR